MPGVKKDVRADALTEVQIAQLRDLPAPYGDGENEVKLDGPDDPRHDLPTDLAHRYRHKSDREIWMYRTHGGDVFLATVDALVAQAKRRERDREKQTLAAVDAAVQSILDHGGDPVTLRPFGIGGLVCCEDERVAGMFSVAGDSFAACIIQSAAEPATEENRDRLSNQNLETAEARRRLRQAVRL